MQPITRHQAAHLVGKGPSLDHLGRSSFPDPLAPVLAVNEAIHAVEALGLPNPLYCVQQDASLGGACRPARAAWLVSSQAWAAAGAAAYPLAYMYDPAGLGHTPKSLTACVALSMLHAAGIGRVTMHAFDARHGVNGYARAIGHSHEKRGASPTRFMDHAVTIAAHAGALGIALEWARPPQRWSVVTLLRTGGVYTTAHRDALRDLFRLRCRSPHEFLTLGNTPCATHPLVHGWPGWFSKMELFRERLLPLDAPVLYVDLDTYPSRDFTLPPMSALLPGRIHARPDGWRKGLWHTGVMAFLPVGVTTPYEWYRDRQPTAHKGDEEIIREAMGPHGFAPLDPVVKARSYKIDKPAMDEADIIYFHGSPKPWDPELAWVDLGKTDRWRPTPPRIGARG